VLRDVTLFLCAGAVLRYAHSLSNDTAFLRVADDVALLGVGALDAGALLGHALLVENASRAREALCFGPHPHMTCQHRVRVMTCEARYAFAA
jgi:hypothetical protein